MARTRGPAPGIMAPLAHAPFRTLVAGRVLMLFGNGMATVALAFAVLDVTGSLAQVGLVVGARSIANVALLLLGGVLADRLPRALVVQGACVLAALTQGLLALTLLTGTATLAVMMVLSALNGAAAAANLPALAALTPQTVPHTLLRQANALAGIAKQLGMFAGMSAGGVLVGLVGPGWAIGVDALLFAAAGAVFLFLRVPSTAVPGGGSVLRDLLDGWSEFVARPWVWIIVLQFMVVNAGWSATTSVLGPGIADETFGRTTWGLVMAANSVGLLVGGILAARWQPRRALFFGTSLVTLQTLPFFVLADPAPVVPLLFAAMFLGGVAVEQFSVAWEVSVQENIPPERLSRVYSYDALGSFVAMPVGQIAIGPVAEAIGPGRSILIVAGLTIAATLAAIATPSVRSLRRR
ncbi:MFS transporter [Nocardiopsis exhalans]|uniref:MFS transporter n=1 Tax=Nocardiopsis exhalans TaxID=163604 RepID=A0ABY5D3Y3_9ACTN|nr:MFS transporter [Nocardiopsis exhalans]USY19004.1 MFS transporter [Nocardiopsis exhalans]